MNVLIYGYGLENEGFANTMYYLKKGHSVRITDIRNEESLGESLQYLKSLGAVLSVGKLSENDFNWADLVIKTPSLLPDEEMLWHAKQVKTDFDCLFSNSNINNVKLLFITGNSNKGRTSSSICHALNALGHKTRMCGNMGISPYSELEKWEKDNLPEYLICELTSMQARETYNTLSNSFPKIELTIISDISENAGSIDDVFITDIKSEKYICSNSFKSKLVKDKKIRSRNIVAVESYLDKKPKKIPSNMSVAFAVLRVMGFSVSDCSNALLSYKGIPNRSEVVAYVDNIMAVNDSAATFPELVAFTYERFSNLPVHVICGGTERLLSAEPMERTLKSCSSIHLLDGSFTRMKLIPLLEKNKIKYNGPFMTMKEAVESAKSSVGNGKMEVILLSPGASAFEHFAGMYDRGNKFKKCFS